MLIAENAEGIRVLASMVYKCDSLYYCPECRERLDLKKGAVNVHHFAHKPDSRCTHDGYEESEDHSRIKVAIYEALEKAGVECELEKRLVDDTGKVNRADIWFTTKDGQQVAIEVQRSNLSVDTIAYRSGKYAAKGIAVVWVIPTQSPHEVFTPRDFERWLYLLNGGKIYYYVHGTRLMSAHFAKRETNLAAVSIGGTVDLLENFEVVRVPAGVHEDEEEGREWSMTTDVDMLFYRDTLKPWWTTREVWTRRAEEEEKKKKELDRWLFDESLSFFLKCATSRSKNKQGFDTWQKIPWTWNHDGSMCFKIMADIITVEAHRPTQYREGYLRVNDTIWVGYLDYKDTRQFFFDAYLIYLSYLQKMNSYYRLGYLKWRANYPFFCDEDEDFDEYVYDIESKKPHNEDDPDPRMLTKHVGDTVIDIFGDIIYLKHFGDPKLHTIQVAPKPYEIINKGIVPSRLRFKPKIKPSFQDMDTEAFLYFLEKMKEHRKKEKETESA